ncbi:MAG: alanine racemase, partial [Acidobacteriota bacterium]|nr:alanine racemase [Acidobacteriota bacterium]
MRDLSTPSAHDHARLQRACAELAAPFACVDLDAFDQNAKALARRAGAKAVRVASKSLRCRALLERVLGHPDGAFQGVLALTVAEAIWLSEHGVRDVVVGYPSVDERALGAVVSRGSSGTPDEGITLMVDAVEHLELLASLGGPVQVCLEADAGLWLLGGRVRVGPRRSPLHTPAQVAALAREIERRPSLKLTGMMAYEGQIAGVGDHPAGRP